MSYCYVFCQCILRPVLIFEAAINKSVIVNQLKYLVSLRFQVVILLTDISINLEYLRENVRIW